MPGLTSLTCGYVAGQGALPGGALGSHRGGQGFKSPQLHPGQQQFLDRGAKPLLLSVASKRSNPWVFQAACLAS